MSYFNLYIYIINIYIQIYLFIIFFSGRPYEKTDSLKPEAWLERSKKRIEDKVIIRKLIENI